MSCNSQDVPVYLHWNNRSILTDSDFLDEHCVYRLVFSGKEYGNPIEFPQGNYTALSCKWSLLIQQEHVLTIDVPPLGDVYRYAFVQSFREYLIKGQKNDGGSNLGWHKLTCVFNHDPKECDYSHCEINIRHEIFEDEDESTLIDRFVYTYQIWQNREALLQSKNSFLKTLAKDYRKDMIKLFCLPAIELVE